MTSRKTLLAWSSGKDSAWSLHVLNADPAVDVVGLVTTINAEFDRVAMHAVRRELVERQVAATGLEPWLVEIPHGCSNEKYEAAVARQIERAQRAGIEAMAFGDLFLEDVRQYRLEQLEGTGIEPVFPLWQQDTAQLARQMLAGGLKTRITCVDPRKLDRRFAGREWDQAFLDDLPEDVDPCGENGEFHSFTYAGPMFDHPIRIEPGEVVERDGFVFADVLPA